MAIETFTRDNLKPLHAELKAAVEAVAKRHGLVLEINGGSFTPDLFRVKVEFTTGSHTVVTPKGPHLPGITVGAEFKFNGKVYTVVGTKRGRDHAWVIGQKVGTTLRYKFKPEDVTGAPDPTLGQCPECKQQTCSVKIKRLGPELARVQYSCPCGYRETDVLD